jgi:hypothetical protein
LLLAVSALVGCATAAQRQAKQIVAGQQEAVAQNKACLAAVLAKPEYAPLLPHTPNLETGQHTMAQLTDETIPSAEDARLVAASFDEANSCFGRFLTALSTVRPDLVPIFADAKAKATAASVLLVERKITWAEGARRGEENVNDLRRQIEAANQRLSAQLNASSQAEMAQRQAAAAAIMQWSAQQQMINAMNRPVIVAPAPAAPVYTTCNQLGSFVNCTSR